MARVKPVTARANEQKAGGKTKTKGRKTTGSRKKAATPMNVQPSPESQNSSIAGEPSQSPGQHLFSDLDKEDEREESPSSSPIPDMEEEEEKGYGEDPNNEVLTAAQEEHVMESDEDNEEEETFIPKDLMLNDLSQLKLIQELDEISMALTRKDCDKASNLLSDLDYKISKIPFFRALDDYLKVWDYKEVIRFFVEKKLQGFNEARPKTLQDKSKNDWNLATQEFCICVPCFHSGRSPQRCIFFCYNGFVNHRGNGVSNAVSTVETLCVKSAEPTGYRVAIGQDGKNTLYPGVNKKKGIEKGDFVRFELPFLEEKVVYQLEVACLENTKLVWVFKRPDEENMIKEIRGLRRVHFLEWVKDLVSKRDL